MLVSRDHGDNRPGPDPIFRPPPGVKPNPIDPPTRGQQIVVTGIILTVITISFVVARLSVKRFIIKKLSFDDLFIILALVFDVAYTVIAVIQIENYKVGRHIWDMPPSFYHGTTGNITKDLTSTLNILYQIGIMFGKISLLLLYTSIFNIKPWFKRLSFGMMALVCAYCLLFVFLFAFYCSPVASQWHPIGFKGESSCLNQYNIYWASGAFNIVTDLALLLMPLPVILKLQIHKQRKIGLTFIFATGTFTVIAAVVREAIVVQTLQNPDPTWNIVPTNLWLSIELNIGIVGASLPTLGPLYRATFWGKFVPRSLMRSLVSRSTGKTPTRSEQDNPYHNADSEVELAPSRGAAFATRQNPMAVPERGHFMKRTDVEVLPNRRTEPQETF